MSSFFGGVKARVTRIYDSLLGRNYWNSIDRQAGVGTLQGVAYAVAGAVAGGVAAQPEILGDAISNLISNSKFMFQIFLLKEDLCHIN